MDSGQFEQATILVHLASFFGFTTNVMAFLTIRYNAHLHTSFGFICACLAANNSFVLVLNSSWYLMPDSERFAPGSFISQLVGTIGLTLWMLGNRFHLLISVNRLFAIAFPMLSGKYMTARVTAFVAALALGTAFLQCSPLIFVDDLWFCYDRKTLRWSFPRNDNALFYEAYVCDLPVVFELGSILILDMVTLLYLRNFHKKEVFTLSNVNASETRSAEIRLFKQSISQSVPLLVDFISFAFITPLFTNDFYMFLTTTFVWHMEHGVDGLIIVIFHTRLDMFKNMKKSQSSVGPSS